jgi:hypothetical protein
MSKNDILGVVFLLLVFVALDWVTRVRDLSFRPFNIRFYTKRGVAYP